MYVIMFNAGTSVPSEFVLVHGYFGPSGAWVENGKIPLCATRYSDSKYAEEDIEKIKNMENIGDYNILHPLKQFAYNWRVVPIEVVMVNRPHHLKALKDTLEE